MRPTSACSVNMEQATERLNRVELAGQCQRNQELPASKLELCELIHGQGSQGHPTLTYVDILKKDAEPQGTNELAICTGNQEDWKQ